MGRWSGKCRGLLQEVVKQVPKIQVQEVVKQVAAPAPVVVSAPTVVQQAPTIVETIAPTTIAAPTIVETIAPTTIAAPTVIGGGYGGVGYGGGVYGGGAIAAAPTIVGGSIGAPAVTTGVYGGGVIGAPIVETFGTTTMGANDHHGSTSRGHQLWHPASLLLKDRERCQDPKFCPVVWTYSGILCS